LRRSESIRALLQAPLESRLTRRAFLRGCGQLGLLVSSGSLLVGACSGSTGTGLTCALSDGMTIHEFPHPRVVVHAHPDQDDNQLAVAQFALDHGAHAIELDLWYRASDRTVVCNHESPNGPSLRDTLEVVFARKAASPTVYGDGRQFFLVLEPKEPPDQLFDGIISLLGERTQHLSTAVAAGDPPRGITVVITGRHRPRFCALHGQRLNRLCVMEDAVYSGPVTNVSGQPFQWTAFSHAEEQERGHVNVLHTGADPQRRVPVNVRVYDTDANDDLRLALASGADSINCNMDKIEPFKQIVQHQAPRGVSPSLAIVGTQALLGWRGVSSNNLYVAVGALDAGRLRFERQINLTYLLQQQPMAIAPAVALLADGRLIMVYEGTDNHRLWYVIGRFVTTDRLVAFDGREHRLTLPDDHGRRGRAPSVAVAPDGQVVVVYEGTDEERLWYVTGRLNDQGEIVGAEHRLTQDDGSRRGHTPSIAIDPSGTVMVVYEGTDNQHLFYVTGRLDPAGRIVGDEHRLTNVAYGTRRGVTPSVGLDGQGHALIAYEGTSDQRLWYVSGFLGGDGQVDGMEFRLTEGEARRGHHPTVSLKLDGRGLILYQGTAEGKIWYVTGEVDGTGRLVGDELLLDMGMDPI
jgi:hypothetical protein